jgi:hypothetical protein
MTKPAENDGSDVRERLRQNRHGERQTSHPLVEARLFQQDKRHGKDDPHKHADERTPPRVEELIHEGDGDADHHDHYRGSEPTPRVRSHGDPWLA